MTRSARGTAHRLVVLVHGNAGSGRIWERVVRALGAAATCAAIDLPGFGASRESAPAGADLLGTYVRAVVAAAQSLGGPVVLAGNGIGSVLCGHAALALGEACGGVVMTGPVGLAGGHAGLGPLSRSRAGSAFLRLAGATALGRGRFLGDQLAQPAADAESARILCDALRGALAFHLLARLNRPESLAGLRALACPVAVLWGERDGVLAAPRAREFLLHLPPHARLDVVADASHALPLERPDLVADAVRRLARDPD